MSAVIEVGRAITVTQPWATLLAIQAKTIETRSWPTKYRGWIAIHASKGFPRHYQALCESDPFKTQLQLAGYQCAADLPRGQVVAIANMADCRRTEELWQDIEPMERGFGDYSDGRYGFVMGSIKRLRDPAAFACKGALGIWLLFPGGFKAEDFV